MRTLSTQGNNMRQWKTWRPENYCMFSCYTVVCFLNSRAAELTQYRRRDGFGPSSNTCPKWEPHILHVISTRWLPTTPHHHYYSHITLITCFSPNKSVNLRYSTNHATYRAWLSLCPEPSHLRSSASHNVSQTCIRRQIMDFHTRRKRISPRLSFANTFHWTVYK